MSKFICYGICIAVWACVLGGCGGYNNATKDIRDLQYSQQQQDRQLAELDEQQAQLQASLEGQLAALTTLLASLQATQSLTNATVEAVQGQMVALQVQLATLQGYEHIASIADPCDDAAGIVDEILLLMADGQVIASFSDNANGKNTRFAVVPPGAYTTTDGSSCQFTVNNEGVVAW